MNDIASQHQLIRTELNQAISDVINSGAFINGPQVKSFQKNLGAYLGLTMLNRIDVLQTSQVTYR